MLIRDEAVATRMDAGEAREEHRQVIADTIALQTRAEVKNFEESPTNPLRQWGKPMMTADFERKLRPILPDFVKFMPNPKGAGLRHMYLVAPGVYEHLMAYPSPNMPEHSICYTYVEDVPDMSVTHIDRKDVPDAKFISKEEGWEFDTTSAPLAGFKRVETVGPIALKGWRQVLIQLSMLGICTPQQLEAAFGADDRAEWSHKLGKQDAPTVW